MTGRAQHRRDDTAPTDLLLDRLARLTAHRTSTDPSYTHYTIGELTERFQVTKRALRLYEDRGLLQPSRKSGWRFYSRYDVERLKLILMGKQVGLSIREIGEILDLSDQGATQDDLLAFILDKLEEQAGFLRSQVSELQEALSQLTATAESLRSALAKNRGKSKGAGRSAGR